MEYIAGVIHVAVIFLSVVAGFFAISLLHVSHRTEHLKPWKYLIGALVLFSLEEILGALISFKIILPTFLTHLIPGIILVFLILALHKHTTEHTRSKSDL